MQEFRGASHDYIYEKLLIIEKKQCLYFFKEYVGLT